MVLMLGFVYFKIYGDDSKHTKCLVSDCFALVIAMFSLLLFCVANSVTFVGFRRLVRANSFFQFSSSPAIRSLINIILTASLISCIQSSSGAAFGVIALSILVMCYLLSLFDGELGFHLVSPMSL